MNRSRKGSQRHPRTTGTVAASLVVVLLLILVSGATKLALAQVQNTVTPTATPSDTPTVAPSASPSATQPPVVNIADAGTATAVAVVIQTAEARITQTAVANVSATLTAIVELSTRTAIDARTTQTAAANATKTAEARGVTQTAAVRNTGTAVANATGTFEARSLTQTVAMQSTGIAVAALTETAAQSTRAYEATSTAVAATAPAPPTTIPSPLPEPTAIPSVAPTAVPTLVVPTGLVGPGGGNLSGILLGAVALVALIAAVVIAVLILRKRRGPAVPSGTPTPPSGGPQLTTGGEPSMAAVLTTLRPLPGVPLLESQGRPAGILYFPLSKPAISVGRAADNDLVIDGSFAGWQTVSRHHATLEYDGSRVVVVGRETPNGIQVNSQRTGSSVLHDGWMVSFGQVKFVFRDNQRGGA